ncbi:MAG: hypothetical protein OER21_16600 [Gemmatimonadota bacterium]|nr:hypothetical protein [Gemmatimonadota bacterium]
MFEAIRSYLPTEWQRTVEFLGAPLWWVPDWQATVLGFTLTGQSVGEVTVKAIFLLLPLSVLVLGVWVTMLSLYTLPFRSERGRYVSVLTLTWWDFGRSTWFFWAGVVRLAVVLTGWVWGMLALAVRYIVGAVKGTVQSPFLLLDWTSRRYFKPGVPWVAFLLTILWSALEATIFTYTLLPTLTEVLGAITGFDPNPAVMTPILWILLFLLIAGSFACVLVLAESIRQRDAGRILQMVFVEFFVMFFEVVFLYRELIDAVTPWIAQQTNGDIQLGLWSTLALAAFGWVGIRGMTWFLFGRFGTPALIAVLSRETLTQGEPLAEGPPVRAKHFKDAVAALQTEVDWFKREARHVFELLSLPILQLLAAAVNFVIVVVRSQPVFRLPFRDLDEVLAATPFVAGSGGERRRSAKASSAAPVAPATSGGGS